jgi:hypothetical protein
MTPDVHLAGSLVAAAICLGSLLSGYRHVTETTLRACWIWCLVSLVALTLAAMLALGPLEPGPAMESHLRHAAGITTFCPLMALLGAKRPQDRAWQFIVLSLWIVLMLPSLASLVDRPEATLGLHGARQWFLAVLIAVGLFNGIATRYWPSSLLAAAAQVLLLASFLPWLDEQFQQGLWASRAVYSSALACLAVAAVLRAAGWPRRPKVTEPLDRLWLDFRDRFGAVWGLRVAERMMAAAHLLKWPLRLGWHGFSPTDPAADLRNLPPETRRAVEKSLRTLLRRFVSSAWIAQRLDSPQRNEKASA